MTSFSSLSLFVNLFNLFAAHLSHAHHCNIFMCAPRNSVHVNGQLVNLVVVHGNPYTELQHFSFMHIKFCMYCFTSAFN